MNTLNYFSLLFIFSIIINACNSKKSEETMPNKGSIKSEIYTTTDGTEVNKFVLTNAGGIEVTAMNYGGIITSIKVPDRNEKFENIILGFDSLETYLSRHPFFGALVGRYGNRIENARFSLDDTEYTLTSSIHGGPVGFDKVFWGAAEFENENGVGIKLTHTSPDMDQGFPGNLDLAITYFLSNDNELSFDYYATTDKPTIVNLTQHSYFNLSAFESDVLGHELMLNSSKVLVVNDKLIPTGEYRPVAGTPFDFTISKTLGRDIESDDEQLAFGRGYDHCFVINESDDDLPFLGTVYEPQSGRVMEWYTTEPGVQLYTANNMNNVAGRDGVTYMRNDGFCLEPQHYPDSPNKPEFPTTRLNPGEEYHTITKIKFSTK